MEKSMSNYKILFEQCGQYRKGDVVNGVYLGDCDYLIRVGAVEETDQEESRAATSVEISEYVSKATSQLQEEVDRLKDELESLSKKPNVAEKKMLINKIDMLTKQVEALTDENTALKLQVEELSTVEVEEENK
jgi:hypothetical protein